MAERLRGLYLDLGGVYFNEGLEVGLQRLSQAYNIPSERLRAVFQSGPGVLVRTGQISSQEFWCESFRDLKIPYSAEEVDRAKKIWFSSYEVRPGVRELITSLRGKILLGVLSNNFEDRVDYLERQYKFRKLFDVEVFSHETGFKKPDREVYIIAVQRMNDLRPEEIVFIDDKDYRSVVEALGARFILFRDVEDLKSSLGAIAEG